MFKYVITLTMALAMIFSASLAFAHSRGVANAFFTDDPPVIDGDPNDPQWQERWAEFQAGDNGTGPSMHMKPETTPDWFIFPETSPNRISRAASMVTKTGVPNLGCSSTKNGFTMSWLLQTMSFS